ncbi:MAG: SIS domain-containing protein [Candidatus Magasanikbacteria bacterium]
MDNNDRLINHSHDYFKRLQKALDDFDHSGLHRLINKIQPLRGTDKTIFVAGNGGSAATCTHMVTDIAKTILGKNVKEKENRFRIMSLNDNTSIITAWANDEGYEHIFSQQLKNLGRAGDILIVFTGSGQSPNIVELVKMAKKMNIFTFGISGFSGGSLKDLCDDYLLAVSNDYGIIEDFHMVVVHLITDWLKKMA